MLSVNTLISSPSHCPPVEMSDESQIFMICNHIRKRVVPHSMNRHLIAQGMGFRFSRPQRKLLRSLRTRVPRISAQPRRLAPYWKEDNPATGFVLPAVARLSCGGDSGNFKFNLVCHRAILSVHVDLVHDTNPLVVRGALLS